MDLGLVEQGETPWVEHPNCVLVGVTPGRSCEHAATRAVHEAAARQCALVAMYVKRLATASSYALIPAPVDLGSYETGQAAIAQRLVRGLVHNTGLDWAFIVGEGDPVSELLSYAAMSAAQLVVVGQSRRPEFLRSPLGSTSRRLRRQTQIPTVIAD